MWAGSLPFYAAAERGAYGAVKVEFQASESNLETYQAVRQGQLELLSMSLFDALELLDKGADFKIIMATSYSNGADGLVAQRAIASLQDLRGKRISVGVGTYAHLILLRALEKGGVPESDVTLVNLSTRQSADAFQEGKVDAAMLWEPFLTQSHTSASHTLFTTAEIPAEMPDVLLARSDVVERRRDDLLDVLRGWDKIVRTWNSHPDQIEQGLARIPSISLDELRSGKSGIVVLDLEGSRALFDTSQPGQPGQKGASFWKAYDATANFMVQHHLIQQTPRPAQEIIDARLVEAAAK